MLLIMLRMLLNADVETAKNNGINAVVHVTHKQAARDAINQATATKRQQINSNREATQEEKMQH